ncbi:MAG TPA: acyclic terpene utilization AtuA family protein [Tepidisphaeraceae bacterium]|nr:acyclic terpene utilization AtuA family protein [Tepidisphaeraceae bacterium]
MPLKIANASAFWGDSPSAPARLVSQVPDLDYLTLDYLAEVSLSILAKQRDRDPARGYPADFFDVLRSLVPHWQAGRRFKLVTNAGGLSPLACAHASQKVLRDVNLPHLRVAAISGDDVLPLLQSAIRDPQSAMFRHFETGKPLSTIADRLTTANAYLGAAPIAEALALGAHVVITGRTADPSLAVGPALHHFGWREDAHDRLAGATVAGHLIECGAQVTGGISTEWLDLPPGEIGFPLVELDPDGSCVVTKPPGTGGRVSQATVKEQLLYELGDPARYLSPDATVNFLTIRLTDDGPDRVRVSGATGGPPPDAYKVSATYRAGFRAAGTLVVPGPRAEAKARRAAETVLARLESLHLAPDRHLVELLGTGVVSLLTMDHGQLTMDPPEVVLRLAVADGRRETCEAFAREFMSLVSAGPQGTTGYAEGRPVVREQFGYWPTLVPRSEVRPVVEVLT